MPTYNEETGKPLIGDWIGDELANHHLHRHRTTTNRIDEHNATTFAAQLIGKWGGFHAYVRTAKHLEAGDILLFRLPHGFGAPRDFVQKLPPDSSPEEQFSIYTEEVLYPEHADRIYFLEQDMKIVQEVNPPKDRPESMIGQLSNAIFYRQKQKME